MLHKIFFFVYVCLFNELHVTIPFNEFTMGVLRILNIAPTQLHPNSWAAFQAFRAICDAFRLMSSPNLFFFYYNSRLTTLVSWLSLTSRLGSIRFAPFTSSYKHFNERYFKNFVETDAKTIIFFIRKGNLNFTSIWPKRRHVTSLGQGSPWLPWTKKYFVYSINFWIGSLLGSFWFRMIRPRVGRCNRYVTFQYVCNTYVICWLDN